MKELLLLLALGGAAYYGVQQIVAEPAPAAAPSKKRRSSSSKKKSAASPPKGRGPWAQKEVSCSRDRCTIGWENTSTSPTGWASSLVTAEASEELPLRVQSLEALKKRPGVLDVRREA